MRTRQPALPFRRGRVVAMEDLSPTLRRVVVEGDELREMDLAEPGGGARLLLPSTPERTVDLPVWNGNAYYAEDGSRPPIRTMTPLDQDPAAGRVAFEVVRHDGGLLTPWVDAVALGGEVAVSGPSRGYTLAPGMVAATFLGDQSALPAIRQLVAAAPAEIAVAVIVEVPGPSAEIAFAERPGLTVRWLHADRDAAPGDTLVDVVAELGVTETSPLWAAGEAAAMQRIRRRLFEDRGLARSLAHVRGYWKHGRGGEPDET